MLTMTRTGKTKHGYLKEVTRAPRLIEGWTPCPKKVWKRAVTNPSGDPAVRYDPLPAKQERRAKNRRNFVLRWKDRIKGKRYTDCFPSTK